MSEMYSFGDWVRRRRKALDLTQDALARQVGCAVSMIRKIEADERRPSPQIAALLAAALEVPDAEREQFLQVARGERSADRLATSDVSIPAPAAHVSQALPTGTVTFQFTDIEGSTRLWERHPQAMREALAQHDSILQKVIAAHFGALVKRTGDGVHAAFARPADAVATALEAQRTFQAAEWGEIGRLAVRVALHTGSVEERDGDFYGPALNRAARLLSAAHGGQILLSRATYELVRDHLEAGVTLRDLGVHHLRDLDHPEHIYQLVAPDLTDTFPPLATRARATATLPVPATPLIGRERELEGLRRLVAHPGVRLLTLTGPGGTGKTRLAVQLASELAEQYADGAVFVDLAPLTAVDQVVAVIAQVLGVKELAGTSLEAQLGTYLQPKHLLLVLDNFEHVLDAAPLVVALLRAAPRLTVLVTSRVVLHLSGEQEYPVPPLGLPPDERRERSVSPIIAVGSDQKGAIDSAPAVQLFVVRALAVQPDFTLSDANRAAVAGICRQLDGLPLAIELAAARIKLFPPDMLLTRLDDRFRLLSGGARDMPVRQQTLRTTIAWSYDLLTPALQRLFWRLGVFAGGWTIEAAETVCDAGGDLGVDVLDGLQALIDHSLVWQEMGSDGIPRFRRLVSIREYARARLAASGEEEILRRRHAHFFLQRAEAANAQMDGPDAGQWLDHLSADYDNLRLVLTWTCGPTGDTAVALRLVDALLIYWVDRAMPHEGLRWTTQVLELPYRPELRAQHAAVLNAAGRLAFPLGELDTAQRWLADSLAIYEQIGDNRSCAEVLAHLGQVAFFGGDSERAVSLEEASLQAARRAGSSDRIIGWALNSLAYIRAWQGQLELAKRWQQRVYRPL